MDLDTLFIDIVVEEVFKNLVNDVVSLKACRLVCRTWNDYISHKIIPSGWVFNVDPGGDRGEGGLHSFLSSMRSPDLFRFTSVRLNVSLPDCGVLSSRYAYDLERFFKEFAEQVEELDVTIYKGRVPPSTHPSPSKMEDPCIDGTFQTQPLTSLKVLKIAFVQYSGLVNHMLASMLEKFMETATKLETFEYKAYDPYLVASNPLVRAYPIDPYQEISCKLADLVPKSVKNISWQGIRFADADVNSIFQSLSKTDLSLTSLKIYFNCGVTGIRKFFAQQCPTLEHFDTDLLLMYSDIPLPITSEDLIDTWIGDREVGMALCIPPKLHFPHLKTLRINNEGIAVMTFLQNFPSLTKLTLGYYTPALMDSNEIAKCPSLIELNLLAAIPRGYHTSAVVGADLTKLIFEAFPNLQKLRMLTDLRHPVVLEKFFLCNPRKLVELQLDLCVVPNYSCPYSGRVSEVLCMDSILTGLPNQVCIGLKENRYRHLDMCNNVERKPNLAWLEGIRELRLTTEFSLNEDPNSTLTDITAHFCFTRMPRLQKLLLSSKIVRIGNQYLQRLREQLQLEVE